MSHNLLIKLKVKKSFYYLQAFIHVHVCSNVVSWSAGQVGSIHFAGPSPWTAIDGLPKWTAPPSKKCLKVVFSIKRCQWQKEGKGLTFQLGLFLAMEDVFLGCLSLFVSVIPLHKSWSLEQVQEPGGHYTEQNHRGKEHKFWGFLQASWSFIFRMSTAKEMAMYNGIAWA